MFEHILKHLGNQISIQCANAFFIFDLAKDFLRNIKLPRQISSLWARDMLLNKIITSGGGRIAWNKKALTFGSSY